MGEDSASLVALPLHFRLDLLYRGHEELEQRPFFRNSLRCPSLTQHPLSPVAARLLLRALLVQHRVDIECTLARRGRLAHDVYDSASTVIHELLRQDALEHIDVVYFDIFCFLSPL